MTARRGASLAELALVSWLFLLVLLGLARFAVAQGRLSAGMSDRVRFEELLRATRVVLGRETRYLAPGDVRSIGADSLRARAVRGSGAVCGWGAGHVVVRYRGTRWPDPAKDSLLLIGERSRGYPAYGVLAASTGTGCPGGLRLDLDRGIDSTFDGGMAMIFESGAYVLTGGALRYRLGSGGRQPLTEAVLDHGRMIPGPAGSWAGLRILLSLHDDSLPRVTPRDHAFILAPAPAPGGRGTGAVP